MTGNITSNAVNIQFLDNVGIQLNFTGTPTGTFAIQVSADFLQFNGNVQNAGNWITLPITAVAAGVANQIYLDINQLSAPYIRVAYTFGSSAGTLDAYVTAKAV